MHVDTYVIVAEFADYDTPATATDYVSVVGQAYATARKDAAYCALNWLRSTPQMAPGQTTVPAKSVTIEVWRPESYSPTSRLIVEQNYAGDVRGIVSELREVEQETSVYPFVLPRIGND